MLRPRIPQLCQLPVPHSASSRLYAPAPLVRRWCAPSPTRPPIITSRHLTTSPRRFNEPSKAASQSQLKKSSTSSTPPPAPEQAPAPAPEPADEPQQPEPSPPATKRRRRRRVFWAAAFFFLGTSLGTVFRVTLAPPALPEPGTAEDRQLLAVVHRKAASLPLIQQLSSDPAWTSWDAYSGVEDVGDNNDNDNDNDNNDNNNSAERGSGGERKRSRGERRLTSGALAGARGLAYQRVFHNRGTGECVSVVYFGGGTAGWPGVVHGGAVATVLDESLGRAAILRFPARTGVTARLELTYNAPTRAEAFYVVRARPVVPDGDDAPDEQGARRSDRKLWVEGAVETLHGRVLVTAKALFVVPKGVKLAPLAMGF